MKKALTKAVLIAMTIVILAAIIPLSANASTSNTKTQIYNFLTENLGLSSAAACGIMANIDAESDFNPKLVITDSNGLLSGGLCQWNGGRFSKLRSFCSSNGLSYLSVTGQLKYLAKELSSSTYGYIFDYLKNVSDTAQGAYDAAYYWCYYFEVPANRSTKSVQRGNAAVNTYWSTYGNTDLSEVTLTSSKSKIDIDSSITFKWNSAGSAADSYTLVVAEKKGDEYDWDNAKSYTLSSSSLKKTIKGGTFDKGTYKAYVTAKNNLTGKEETSNYVTFKVVCTTHEYKTTIKKQATTESTGIKIKTCKQCSATEKVITNAFSVKSFANRSVSGLEKVSSSKNAVRVSWNQFGWAEGYLVYIYKDGKWVKVRTLNGYDTTACNIKNLESNTVYKVRVKAYIKVDGKVYTTKASETLKIKTAK